jgi:glutathione synthase/RimK-type ligase-like ATP-grasp enzyme
MGSVVGILCARMRVEEKQVFQALAQAGVPARLLPPAAAPLPIGPVPPTPLVANGEVTSGETPVRVILDRCQNRSMAASILPLRRLTGETVIDAGLAATGTRADVAAALSRAGVPRPVTMLVTSGEAGMTALDACGYPATYLPLVPGAAEIALLDRDTAEAVFEHRETLGGTSATIGVLQAGTPLDRGIVSIVVVDGRAVAIADPSGQAHYAARFLGVAEAAACTLGASVIGINLIVTRDGPIVWDVDPIPDFRDAMPLGPVSAAEAIADLVARHVLSQATIVTQLALEDEVVFGPGLGREVAGGVALSA